MLTYTFDRGSKVPLYEQLYNFIKADIISGVISGGEKLPSKREFASHLGISKVTVEAAYGALTDEGYVTSVEKKGYYCENNLAIPADTGSRPAGNNHYTLPVNETQSGSEYLIDLSSNSVPRDQFPFSVWSHLMRSIIADYSLELLNPIPYNGIPKLREAIAGYLFSERGMSVSPECIFIGSGSEYLYTRITKLLGPGRVFGTENPCYPKITRIYGMNNVRCVPVDIGEDGIDADALRRTDIDVLHISPSHNFPTGFTMSAKTRHDIIAWANSGDRYIVEDDFDSELRFGGRPLPPLQTLDTQGKVIYINTFSKTISPSLRIGYMILPVPLAKRYGELFSFNACTVPSFEQYTLSEFIEKGYFERHISRTKKYYELLRKSLLEEYRLHGLSKKSKLIEADAGLHFILKLKTRKGEKQIKDELAAKGIKAAFISEYCHAPSAVPGRYRHNLLINYSGIDPEKFRTVLDTVYEITEEEK